jgi:sugar O-acyltransferase (sialic acid O-acetyltransferase NeuD family)
MTPIPNGLCVVLGAGGHARVILDILLSAHPPVPCALLEADSSRWGSAMMGVPILGGDDLLPALAQKGVRHFVVGAASVGNSRLRSRLFEYAAALGLEPLPVIHARAALSSWARIGPGVQLFAHSVVNPGAVLGVNIVVNTGAIVEHDCQIEDHAQIATGARLCGAVRVGKGAYIGAGAVVRQGIAIGQAACVGAGSVVVRDVAPETTVAGVPAALLKNRACSPSSE